jgi:hypothetical protein
MKDKDVVPDGIQIIEDSEDVGQQPVGVFQPAHMFNTTL